MLPAWWLILGGTLASGASAALVAARQARAHSSTTVARVSGPAGDLFDDIPLLRTLRAHPLLLCLSAALASTGVVTIAARGR